MPLRNAQCTAMYNALMFTEVFEERNTKHRRPAPVASHRRPYCTPQLPALPTSQHRPAHTATRPGVRHSVALLRTAAPTSGPAARERWWWGWGRAGIAGGTTATAWAWRHRGRRWRRAGRSCR